MGRSTRRTACNCRDAHAKPFIWICTWPWCNVSDDGRSLMVTVVWKRYMTDLHYLDEAEMYQDSKMYEDHPRVLSFRLFLRRLRSKADHKISSTCAIWLPIQVKPDIALVRRRRLLLGCHENSQKVLYVTLEAPDRDYVVDDEGVPEITVA